MIKATKSTWPKYYVLLTAIAGGVYVWLWWFEYSAWLHTDHLALLPDSLIAWAANIFDLFFVILLGYLAFRLTKWWKLLVFPLVAGWLFLHSVLFYLDGRFGFREYDRLVLNSGETLILTRGRSSQGVMLYQIINGAEGVNILPELEYSILYGPLKAEEYQLVPSRDATYLAIRRGNLLTDCIDMTATPISLCQGFEHVPEPDNQGAWQVRSNAIATLLDGANAE